MWCIHKLEYYLARKTNEILIKCHNIWRNLKNIMVSEKCCQKQSLQLSDSIYMNLENANCRNSRFGGCLGLWMKAGII
jgi:hypothetical protein